LKTSRTHPLKIDTVNAGSGVIGLTFCPGKRQAYAINGPWDRNLDADLRTIKDAGFTTLVSLVQDHEFEELEVPGLGERTEALGLEWHHLPIEDVNVPDQRFEQAWAYAGHRLRHLLGSGEKIVIHCKGGLGRTGTIAGRLMIELGDDPDDSIRAIREARPGSIETFGYENSQEDYVRRRRRISGDPEYADRVLGCLLGGAVGDAFGYEVEFNALSTIRSRFGEHGIREPVYHSGALTVSDDTQMTLFTLEGLLRSELDDPDGVNEQIRLAYSDWLSTQSDMPEDWEPTDTLCQVDALNRNRAPGNTCLSALQSGGWGTPENAINNSKGCGGVMRVAPIGLIRDWSPKQAFNVAASAAAITHGHPSGFWSAAAMSAMVRMMVDGQDLERAAEASLEMLADKPGHEETTDAIDQALKTYRSEPDDHTKAIRRLGEGWVGEEALSVSLYAALSGNSFAEVMAIGANHDGDSDSTASIAGQLYGAWKGLSDLPHAWTRRLDVFNPMMGLIDPLLEHKHRQMPTTHQ
jgi:ADP-ribosyl-[dinitrogen reductase] hydrolase